MTASQTAAAAAAPTAPLVLREDRDGVTTLTLNRPAQRNALSRALMAALEDALAAIAGDAGVRTVVLAGAGPVFSAGHDLRELRSDPSAEAHRDTFEACARLMLAVTRLPQPVIARVHGIATAAGCQLVATCDLAVAAADARFATPGVNIGLFCSTPMVALTRAVGRKPAMEMLLTGDMVDAETAQTLGLVNRVVPADRLDAETDALARRIAEKSTATVAVGKAAFYAQADMDLPAAYAHTAEVMTRNMGLADAVEGIDAFLAKRPPEWRDR